jgi:hypothetical protein
MRKKISVVVAVAMFSTLAACGGGEESDKQSPDSTDVLVKNRPLNNCVSVFSGGRPSTSRPQTREEQIAQREAEIAARPPECRPKRP